MFFENLRIALKALWANKLRSVLTTLGVIIGVASVIAVVSLVQGMEHGIANELEGVGATYIRVFPDAGEQRQQLNPRVPDLTYADGTAVLRGAPEIAAFTPIFFRTTELRHLDTRHSALLLGVSETYQEVVNHWVDRGRFFTPIDIAEKKRVATIGVEAARKLGIESDPLGRTIQIDGNAFTLVGLMEEKGQMFGQDQDDLVLIPFTTAAVVYGTEAVRTIVLDFQAASPNSTDLAREQIREILRSRHGLEGDESDDFRIILQEEILETVSRTLLMTSLIMAAVVGIALLVGGIGIMNIMLVSVTERTREIGIRKAVGARRQDVLLQFLIEAIALSGLGGVIGILAGMGMAATVRQLLTRWVTFPEIHTPLWAVTLAFGFCAALGVIFGIYPAAKASKLDPIEALRYE
ncbi:MAG TPA: ABC transporter permease [Thermoanaerobaculia bacterium]|nr:ABC transporter permease [Thermoanaerobaculia bacterium]